MLEARGAGQVGDAWVCVGRAGGRQKGAGSTWQEAGEAVGVFRCIRVVIAVVGQQWASQGGSRTWRGAGLIDGGQDAHVQGSWPMGDARNASGSVGLAWGALKGLGHVGVCPGGRNTLKRIGAPVWRAGCMAGARGACLWWPWWPCRLEGGWGLCGWAWGLSSRVGGAGMFGQHWGTWAAGRAMGHSLGARARHRWASLGAVGLVRADVSGRGSGQHGGHVGGVTEL